MGLAAAFVEKPCGDPDVGDRIKNVMVSESGSDRSFIPKLWKVLEPA